MKVTRSIPADHNFFSAYAPLIAKLRLPSYLAQLVSAGTEFIILFFLASQGCKDIFPQAATPVGIVVGALATLVIELVKRGGTPYSIRAILYRRFKGVESVISATILLITVLIFTASFVLSFQGSKEVVAAIIPEAPQQTTAAIDSMTNAQTTEIQLRWAADSAAVADIYAPQIDAVKTAAKSQYNSLSRQLKSLEAKERNTEMSYASQKSKLRDEMDAINDARDIQLANLEAQKGRDLREAQVGKSMLITGLQNQNLAQRDTIAISNALLRAGQDQKVQAWGGGLAWFTVICDLFLLVFIIISEINQKKSGIEESVHHGQYDHAPSIASEFMEAISERFNRKVRGWIHNFSSRTEDPIMPKEAKQIYDFAALKQTTVKPTVEEGGEEQQIIIPFRRNPKAAEPRQPAENSPVVPTVNVNGAYKNF